MVAHLIQDIGLNKGEKVICAVSGGVDSMVLMDALIKAGIDVIVAHVDHQLRPESHDETLWLKDQMSQRNIRFFSEKIEIDKAKNVQNQGHWKRLAFYQKLANKVHTYKIFLGHHLNDQLEHFLMKIIRGDQPFSWSGMKDVRRYHNLMLYRPFLKLPKQVLIDYAQSHQIDYLEDPSNQSTHYFRNQIRHLFVPKILEKDPDFLRVFPGLLEQCEKAFKVDFKMHHHHGFFYLDETFYDQQKPIHQHFILQSLCEAAGLTSQISEKHFAMIHARLMKDKTAVKFQIKPGLNLIRQYQMLGAYQPRKINALNFEVEKFGTYALNNTRQIIITDEKIRHPYINKIELCYNENTFPLRIRYPLKGDVMRFSYGHKSLKKIFSEHKIPLPLRQCSIIVESKNEMLGILSLNLQAPQSCLTQKIYIYEVLNATQ